MPKISTELLDQVERPSILDGLLLSNKDLKSKHQIYANPKEKPSFTPLPKSQALEKVRDFLQDIAKANKELEIKAHENPCSNYDIEVLNDCEEQYIEMDLLLGVADLHSDAAVAAAEASMSGFQPTVADSEDDNDGDSEDDDFDKNKGIKCCKKPTRHNTDYKESSRKAKQNKRPKVVMLD